MGRGYKRRIEVIVPTFNLVPKFIVGTTRIATLHTRLARVYAQNLPIRLVALPIELPLLREATQWHQYLNQDPGTVWMRQILRESVERCDSRLVNGLNVHEQVEVKPSRAATLVA